MCVNLCCGYDYPSKIQHILQHEADPGGGLPLLYYFLHLIKVLVHTRLKTNNSLVSVNTFVSY